MADPQRRAQAVIDDIIASGKEQGLQAVAYKDGEKVVDVCSGIADPSSGRKVDADSIFTSFSTTKGIVATAAHLAVAQGKLGYDDLMTKYWPEFGQNGKDKATVRMALAH